MPDRRARVLVVEDDVTMREVLGEVMLDEGYEVRLAADGREGLEALRTWEADVVLLDLMMPNMDAFALRAEQHGGAISPATKFVLVSATRNLAEAADVVRADACLAKPFSLEDVTGVVRALLAPAAEAS